MRHPPRAAAAPLLGPTTIRRALLQGGALTVAALVLSHWPGLGAGTQRHLLFSLLLVSAGGLVWVNGEPRERITLIGSAIGVGFWLLLEASPGLQELLGFTPLGAQGRLALAGALALLTLMVPVARRLRVAQAPEAHTA